MAKICSFRIEIAAVTAFAVAMQWTLSIAEIAKLTGAQTIRGTAAGKISGIADLNDAQQHEISFMTGQKFARQLEHSKAGAVLVPATTQGSPAEGCAWLLVDNPSVALGKLCAHVESLFTPERPKGISPHAVVAEDATVAESAYIGPFCIIESGARIGEHAFLESAVHISAGASIGASTRILHGAWIGPRCKVGQRCLLSANCVIGSEGFGFHSDASGHHKLPQIGWVELADDVEVGACSTIDRGRFAATKVGKGSKIDNLVQLGHNVTLGEHCIICAQVGVAGSARMGNFVVLAGQVGVNGHIHIGNGVQAAAKSGISKDVAPGTVLSGMPARPRMDDLKRQAGIGKIAEMAQRLTILEKRLAEISTPSS